MNTARLRADIDAGKTGDKIPGADPAAAPLGTDEEAAGTPIDPALAERVRIAEVRPDGEPPSRQNASPRGTSESGNRTGGVLALVLWLGIGGGLTGTVAVLVWAMGR
jgi:hypothetical protein